MDVSKNRGGPPKSSIFIGLEPLFSPSILGGLGVPLFLVQHPNQHWEHPTLGGVISRKASDLGAEFEQEDLTKGEGPPS